jgi:hypothetical protein
MRLLLPVLFTFFLSGCAMYSDMANNNFPGITPVPPLAKLVGTWTASFGYYLATMRFNADGTGVMCSSWNGKDSRSPLQRAFFCPEKRDVQQHTALVDRKRFS